MTDPSSFDILLTHALAKPEVERRGDSWDSLLRWLMQHGGTRALRLRLDLRDQETVEISFSLEEDDWISVHQQKMLRSILYGYSGGEIGLMRDYILPILREMALRTLETRPK